MLRSLVLAGALALAAAAGVPGTASAASFGNQPAVAETAPAPVTTVQYYGYRRGYGRRFYGRRFYGPRPYYGRRYYRGYYGPRYGRPFYGPGVYVGPRGVYGGF